MAMREKLDQQNSMKVWRNYIIEDAVVIIGKVLKASKSEIINSCWRKLCADVVYDLTGFTKEPIKEIMKDCKYGKKKKKKVSSECLRGMDFGKNQELVDTTPDI